MPYTGKLVSDYITQWLYDNWKSAQQVPNALGRFNRRMHELEEEIVTFVNNDLYTEGIAIDLELWVNHYALPTGNSVSNDEILIPQLKKILEVDIYYDPGQTLPTKCREFTRDNFDQPETRYETYQTTLTPLFGFKGKEIIIYPTPTEDRADWLVIRYAKSALDVTTSTQEDEFPFAWYYINAILVWMSVDLEKANHWNGSREHLSAKQDRVTEKGKALSDLSDRYITATNYRNPNLIHLM